MKKINLFGKALYNNKAVILCREFNVIIGVLLFLIVTTLVSVPFYLGRYQLSEQTTLDLLPHFTESLSEMFETTPCALEDAKLVCNEETKVVGKYTYYFSEPAPEQQDAFTVYFDKEVVSIRGEGEEAVLVGSYVTFGNIQFEEFYTLMQEEGSTEITLLFVKNLLLSEIGFDLIMIYMTNILQNLTYLFLAGLLFIFTNIRHKNSQTFKTSFNMAVHSMVGPALLVACIAMFSTGIASIIFPVLYMARATFIYMRLIKAPNVHIAASIFPY